MYIIYKKEHKMQKNTFKIISSFKKEANVITSDIDKAYESCKPLIEAEKRRFQHEVEAIKDFGETNLQKLGWDIIR